MLARRCSRKDDALNGTPKGSFGQPANRRQSRGALTAKDNILIS
jgi:hypothetical protein